MSEPVLTISLPMRPLRRGLAAAALLALATQAGAEQPAPALPAMSGEDEVRAFCTNIADAARDRRYLIQTQELEKLRGEVDARIAALEARTAEYRDWLQRRNDFLARAQAGLVEIFRGMKPDAAAPQLAEMKMEIAAAIIMQLPPRQSAQVLSEMDPQRAGMISTIISSAADPNTSKAAAAAMKAPS